MLHTTIGQYCLSWTGYLEGVHVLKHWNPQHWRCHWVPWKSSPFSMCLHLQPECVEQGESYFYLNVVRNSPIKILLQEWFKTQMKDEGAIFNKNTNWPQEVFTNLEILARGERRPSLSVLLGDHKKIPPGLDLRHYTNDLENIILKLLTQRWLTTIMSIIVTTHCTDEWISEYHIHTIHSSLARRACLMRHNTLDISFHRVYLPRKRWWDANPVSCKLKHFQI